MSEPLPDLARLARLRLEVELPDPPRESPTSDPPPTRLPAGWVARLRAVVAAGEGWARVDERDERACSEANDALVDALAALTDEDRRRLGMAGDDR